MKKRKYVIMFIVVIATLLVYLSINKLININNYNSVYFTSKESSIISDKDLQENNILEVNSLEKLKSEVKSLNKNVGIILDKNIIDEGNDINSLTQWLIEQKNSPIIVVGYGNPNYVYFKRLSISENKYLPKITDEKFEELKNQKGFCMAYICSDGKIYGKSFTEEINTSKIMKIVNEALKGENNVTKMFGEES